MPEILLLEGRPTKLNWSSTGSSIIYTNTDTGKLPKFWLLVFNNSAPNSKKRCSAQKRISKQGNIRIPSNQTACKLLNECFAGKHIANYEQRKHLTLNLQDCSNGQKVLKQIFSHNNEHPIHYYINQSNRMIAANYLPSNCSDDNCPYIDECNKIGMNINHQLHSKKTDVFKVPNQKFQSLSEAEQELQRKMTEAFSHKSKDIHIIVAQTGLGKTEFYLSTDLRRTGIFAPTHRLLLEIGGRLDKKGIDYVYIPKLVLPSNLNNVYLKLNNAGMPDKALKTIYGMADDNIKKYLTNYFKTIEAAKNASTILATHARLLKTDIADNLDTLIIDEDILSTLLQQKGLKIKDLAYVVIELKAAHIREMAKNIESFLLAASVNDKITLYKKDFDLPTSVELYEALDSIGFFYSQMPKMGNVIKWLDDDTYYINDNTISYGIKHSLPENKKIVIVSATSNENIYRKCFANRKIKFSYIQEAENMGSQIQHFNETFSRQSMKKLVKTGKLSEIFAEVKEQNMPVITFKKFAEDFKRAGFEVIATLGATEGLDEYAGKDIAVIGTPHANPTAYRVLSRQLGDIVDDNEFEKMTYRKIIYNGFNFHFHVYDNEALRDVQLYLIHRELVQAIGRARLLRHHNKVYIYSNFAISQSINSTELKRVA